MYFIHRDLGPQRLPTSGNHCILAFDTGRIVDITTSSHDILLRRGMFDEEDEP